MPDDARVQVLITGRQVGVREAASEAQVSIAALDARLAELNTSMRAFGGEALTSMRSAGRVTEAVIANYVSLKASIAETTAEIAALRAEASKPITLEVLSGVSGPRAAEQRMALRNELAGLRSQAVRDAEAGAAAVRFGSGPSTGSVNAMLGIPDAATARMEARNAIAGMRAAAASEAAAGAAAVSFGAGPSAQNIDAMLGIPSDRAARDAMARMERRSEEARERLRAAREATAGAAAVRFAGGPSAQGIDAMFAIPSGGEEAARRMAARNAAAYEKMRTDAETAAGAAAVSWRRASDDTINSMLRIGTTSRVTAQDVAQAFGAPAREVSRSTGTSGLLVSAGASAAELKTMAGEAERAGHAMSGNSNVIRHAFGMIDSAARDARGQFFSSLGAMIRDTGVLRTAFVAVGPAGMAVGVGVTAAAAALGYFAYEAYEDAVSTQRITEELTLFGGATRMSAADINSLRDRVGDAYGLWASQARMVTQAMATIPGVSASQSEALANLAATIHSAAEGELTMAQASKEVATAASEGGSSLQKFAEAHGYVGVQAETSSGEIDAVTQSIKENGEAVAKNKVEWENWFGLISSGGGMIAVLPSVPPPAPVKPDNFPTMPLESERVLSAAGSADRKRVEQQKAVNDAVVYEGQLRTRLQTNPNDSRAREQLDLTKKYLEDLRAESEREPLRPSQQLGLQRRIDAINREKTLTRDNYDYQASMAQATADATAAAYGEGNERTKVAETEALKAKIDAAVHNQAAQIAAIRAVAAESQQGSAERVTAEERVLQVVRAGQHAQVEGHSVALSTPAQVTAQEGRVTTARREQQRQQYSDFKQEKEAELEAAKGDADKIIAIYAQMRAQLATAGTAAPHGESSRLAREEIAKLTQAQNDLFRESERASTASERVDSARIAAYRASQQAEVAAHQESKAQEAANEGQYTAAVMAGEEQRTEATLQNVNLTRDEKDQLYQHLAELYSKDAEAQQQAEEKITAAIEAENAKRIALFTNMFDTVGSGLEKLATAELTGNMAARGSALRALGTSMVSGAIHTAGSLASDYAGQKVGPMLGLTAEQSKGGLGSVLGDALAKELGLLKDTPKDAAQKSAELFQKAADAQEKAAGTFGDSVKTFADASKRIADAMGKLTPGISASGASAPGGIAALVRHYESGGNYNIGYGGADLSKAPLGPTGFPQWPGKDNSHAAGAYQFEPAEWDKYAKPLGVTDFSPASQDKVFNAAYSAEGLKPWQSNKQLMAAVGSGGGLTSGFTPPISASTGADNKASTQTPLDAYYAAHPNAPPGVDINDIYKWQDEQKKLKATSGSGGGGQPSTTAGGGANATQAGGGIQVVTRYSGGQPVTPDDQAQKAANDQLSTSVRSLDTTTRSATSVSQQGVTATTSATAQGQQTVTALGTDKTAADGLRGATTESKTAQDGLASATKSQQTAVDANTAALKQPPRAAATSATGSGASATSGVPTNALTGANDNKTTSSLGLLTQGLGIASGALAIFGSNLSTGAREILGGISVISQLTNFTKTLNNTFDLFGTATKTASVAQTLSTTVVATNTTGFITNSAAVQTNSAAQTTAAASGAGKSILSSIPIIGSLFSEGGIVYAAAGWPSKGTDTVPAMLTPGESVLTVAQTQAMASMRPAAASVGSVQPNFQTAAPAAPAANNNSTSSFNYAPQINGRQGTMSRGELDSILRSHGDAFTGMARNFVRNNGGLYGR